MTDQPSALLLQRFAAGDGAAADELFARYFERLTRFARSRLHSRLVRRVDAEDVVLSAYRSFFLRAQAGSFSLIRSGDLWRLLSAIVIHKLRRQARHHGRAKRAWQRETTVGSDDRPIPEPASSEPSPAEAIALAQEVEAMLTQLPQPDRRICELRLQGCRLDEIATDVRRSERTVRRVVDALRYRLEQRLLEKRE